MHALDLQAVGLAFGFTTPPRVDLPLSSKGDKKKGHKRDRSSKSIDPKTRKLSNGHTFSASNPYGKRDTGDARQFTH